MENEIDKRDVNRILIKQECLDENKQQEFPDSYTSNNVPNEVSVRETKEDIEFEDNAIKKERMEEFEHEGQIDVATPSLLENGQRYVWNINKVNENTKQNLNKTKDAELIDYNNRDDCGDIKGEFVAENSLKNETNIGNFNLFHSNVFLKNCEDNTNANKMKPENTIEKTDSPIINWNVDVQTNYQVPNKSDKIYNILLITPVHSKLLNVQVNEEKALPKISQKSNIQQDLEKQHSCNICGKAFTSKTQLDIHNRTHTGYKPYSCKVCGACFNTMSNMKKHYRIHSGERPFSCSICSKTFNQSSDLKVHARTHTGEKPYTCSVCGKSFGNFNVLKRHNRIHTGEKPYICQVCGKGFNECSSLKRHIIIHTGEKPYSCNICEKTFNDPGVLRRHIKIHQEASNDAEECDNESEKLKKGNEKERLSCNVCDKTYTKASSLVVHYRLHTGDKPYSCSLCEKTFTYSSSLLFHNRTHTGEKPFSCNICGKSFSRLGHVKTHKLTHTSETPYTCDICKHKFKHKSSLVHHIQKLHDV
ncbi:zinc finger protein 883-like isoform X1 [Leptidea sinapis]|uniref:zinc finger protein 883-like isoform X1 n=2 Tax=Leptidea sinapis TaxID=189913 RepID=UPI0021C33770|nr:zinc finger protein 883-like isoform X1 [Leptidea sinapis]XP_050684817.1 zinc finger protein 883-like isoform X1 [Leptidea sinapis]XP_050684818.1 zinc finger protein 883-like isoform X1 [Leptidea sinapis]XP_050684819.1 zinc finger protein 883-like isoform X1 [Leptidea sinapis]XP_050684820.1 zinc finger protein 883-like isoform X1 [Leptidea sinapis]XP_050684821.1 zinc finger protein 883-like isoform X1 [Leptidea sinapis]